MIRCRLKSCQELKFNITFGHKNGEQKERKPVRICSRLESVMLTFHSIAIARSGKNIKLIRTEISQMYCRGVASFSTSCEPGWLSFPHILKIASTTNATHSLLQAVEWSNQKFVGPGLQVYRLAMPLYCGPLAEIPDSAFLPVIW